VSEREKLNEDWMWWHYLQHNSQFIFKKIKINKPHTHTYTHTHTHTQQNKATTQLIREKLSH
jgi:hypothetical protein